MSSRGVLCDSELCFNEEETKPAVVYTHPVFGICGQLTRLIFASEIQGNESPTTVQAFSSQTHLFFFNSHESLYGLNPVLMLYMFQAWPPSWNA